MEPRTTAAHLAPRAGSSHFEASDLAFQVAETAKPPYCLGGEGILYTATTSIIPTVLV